MRMLRFSHNPNEWDRTAAKVYIIKSSTTMDQVNGPGGVLSKLGPPRCTCAAVGKTIPRGCWFHSGPNDAWNRNQNREFLRCYWFDIPDISKGTVRTKLRSTFGLARILNLMGRLRKLYQHYMCRIQISKSWLTGVPSQKQSANNKSGNSAR